MLYVFRYNRTYTDKCAVVINLRTFIFMKYLIRISRKYFPFSSKSFDLLIKKNYLISLKVPHGCKF